MQTTSITLLERVRSTTDEAAWRRFVELYSPLLAHWAAKAGLADSEVSDVVQDVLVKLVNMLPDFAYDERRNFRGLLKTIASNEVRDRQRAKKPVSASDPTLDLAIDQPLDAIWDEEYRQHLTRQALRIMQSDFERHTWQACWESAVNGRPAQAIAAELGMSEAAVYVAKSRVLRRLREELKGMLD